MENRPSILVLCTGNSCRSQMAEGYLKRFAGDRFAVYSAGLEPREHVHPLAVAVMAEDGIDISQQFPKDLKTYLGRLSIRYLIVVCDAADRACPRIVPGVMHRLYWPFEDPALDDSPTAVERFRDVRDQIRGRIVDWLDSLPGDETA